MPRFFARAVSAAVLLAISSSCSRIEAKRVGAVPNGPSSMFGIRNNLALAFRGGQASEEEGSVSTQTKDEEKSNDDNDDDDEEEEEESASSLFSSLPLFSTWSETVQQPPTTLEFDVAKPGDGSESDPAGVPRRYLNAHHDRRDKAELALEHTKQWRKEYAIPTILARPHSKYDLCKIVFPITIPGRDPSGHLIVVQRPGMIQFDLAAKCNVTKDDLLLHYIYMVEYCWNLLEPALLPPDGLMTTVLDCQGVSFGTFKNRSFRAFLMRFVSTMSEHYPSRSHKTLIINAPKWIKMVFKLVKPLLRERTRNKIIVLNGGPDQDQILKETLGEDTVPKELLLSGTNSASVGNEEESAVSVIEQEMRAFCSAVTRLGGESIQTLTV